MACPAGHTLDSVLNEKTTTTIPPSKFTKPLIYATIAEPILLRTYVNDVIYLLGGQFAILCQFAHPGLALGTTAHSNFSSRLLNRLQTTARFLNAAVYGTQSEKEAIFSVIHSKHSTVKGPGYDGDDPELHKWTAATLYMSVIVVHEAFFGEVSREKREVLYRESAVYGTSLRMPPEMWPKTLDEFEQYWDETIRTVDVTPEAVALSRALLWPKGIPMVLMPMGPIGRVLTVRWLPERLRREYGFTEGKGKKAAYKIIVGYTKVVWPLVPRVLRTLPSWLYMRDMRKAVKRIEETGSWYKTK